MICNELLTFLLRSINMIAFNNTSWQIGNQQVLHDISLQVNDAEHLAITGPLASGKSTLLKAIAGKIQPVSGRTSFALHGNSIDRHAWYTHTALVQFDQKSRHFNSANHYYQQRFESLEDHVSKSPTLEFYFRDLLGTSWSNHIDLDLFSLRDLLNRKLIELSSGQQKKLAITLALAKQPDVLLLDDPYMGMDTLSRNELNSILPDLNLQVVITGRSSDLPEAITHRIQLPGPGYPDCGSPVPLGNNYTFPEILFMDKVSVHYGSEPVLRDISLSLSVGEHIAVTGPNGSGKSTLLSLIYADHPQAYTNNIRLFGLQRGTGESIWDIKRKIGFTSAELHLYFRKTLTAQDVIGTGYFDALTITTRLSGKQIRRIQELASFMGIEDLERPFGSLSTGQQRTLLFVRAIIDERPLILLDEPYQGLDNDTIARANTMLESLYGNASSALLFISHYANEIPAFITQRRTLINGVLDA